MSKSNTVADSVKSALAPSVMEGFKSLGREVGTGQRADRKRWAKYRKDFARLSADFPRLDNGAIDRESDQCEEARTNFIAQAVVSLTEGDEYDRALHRSGDDEYHVPSEERPANFTLTGRNAVSMDKASLSKLPSLLENPLGIRRFVEATRKTVDNTATKAWGRFFEADFIEGKGGKRGANASVDEWVDGLATPMIAKLGAARTAGRKVASNDAAKKALAVFRKALLLG
jgi:hypothetical protein